MKNFAVHIAKKAGQYLIDNFKKDNSLKSARETAKGLTTRYDKESNNLIIKDISAKYHDYNILSEESRFVDKKSKYTWVIDPLDGSTNFANGNPFFSVSIALTKGKEVLLGVVYAPVLEELFVAEKNKGAFLNGKRMHVSNIKELRKSYFICCEGGEKTNKKIAEINYLFHPYIKDLRKLGSAALEGSWVAYGRAESYIVTSIYPWDVASAVLLVNEAGGVVTGFDGMEWNLKKSDLVFSNGLVHNQIIKRINKLF